MANLDPARQKFAAELRAALARPSMSPQRLADRLSTDPEVHEPVTRATVENWRRSNNPVLPTLSLIPHIARITDMRPTGSTDPYDPLYILRRLDLLQDEPDRDAFIDAAWRLQKLEIKLANSQREAVNWGRSRGAAGIVQAALRTQEWAVAVWPAVEGPRHYPMHVADRIDLQRTDGAPITREDVWSVRELKNALRAAYAVPGTRAPRWAPEGNHTSHWSITHVGAPSGPLVTTAHPGLPSLAFSATTVTSWVHDVASLTSLVLGYGLTTTRDLAMETSGLPSGETRLEDRVAIHDRFLVHPPARRVWSHHGPMSLDGSRSPFETRGRHVDPRIVHVRLSESDALLRYAAQRRDLSEEQLDEWRRDRDRAMSDHDLMRDPSRLIHLAVNDRTSSVSARWHQVLDGVRQVIVALHERNLLRADLRPLHEELRKREPEIAPKVFDWLEAHDCPLV